MQKDIDLKELRPEELIALSESTVDDFRHDRSSIYKAAVEKYQQAGDEENRQAMVFEALAFDLWGSNDGEPRFRPQATWVADGVEVGYPDRERHFGEAAIDYYKRRVGQTENPILVARYADIVWDFVPKGNYVYAKTAVESYLNCAGIYLENMAGDRYSGIELADALVRALAISVQVKNDELIDRVLQGDYEIADKLAAAREYRWILDILKSVAARQMLKDRADLPRLRALAEEAVLHYSENDPDSFPIQRSFLEVIADLWKLEGRDDEVLAAKRRIAASYEAEAEFKSGSHLVSMVVLEKALQAYVELGDTPEKVKELKAAIGREHELAEGEYKRVETSVEVSQEVMDAWLAPYRGLSVRECLTLLCADPNILPSYSKSYNRAVENAKEFVFQHIIPMRLNRKGMTVKEVEGEDDKLAYAAAQNFRTHYTFAATFLFPHLLHLLKEKDGDYLATVHQHMADSGVIEPGRLVLIKAGLEAFGREDYVACLHILAPQIEGALRDFLGMLGMPKTSFLGVGEWEAQALNRILDVFATVRGFDQDFVWLIRLLLAEKLGDNLRNEIAHGIAEPEQFNWPNAVLMIYILVKLASYRLRPNVSDAEDGGEN